MTYFLCKYRKTTVTFFKTLNSPNMIYSAHCCIALVRRIILKFHYPAFIFIPHHWHFRFFCCKIWNLEILNK